MRSLNLSFLYLIFFLFAFLVGCSETETVPLDGIKGRTMGTGYSVLWPAHLSVDKQAVSKSIEGVLASVNKQMSTYDPASELSEFNQQSAPYEVGVSPEFYEVMALSQEIAQLTGGYFDVTVGPLVNLWGFGPDNQPVNIPSDTLIKDKLAGVGYQALSIKEQRLSKVEQRYVDLSAVAKGYGVDMVAKALDSHGVSAYLVEIGGELRAKGLKKAGLPWKVAVERPQLHDRAVQIVLPLEDAAMATSGDYRNFFYMDGKRLSHSIDPFTGQPTAHTLASVTVVDQNCARADALATAMLVMGAEKAKKLAIDYNIAAFLIERGDSENLTEFKTPAWNRRFDP